MMGSSVRPACHIQALCVDVDITTPPPSVTFSIVAFDDDSNELGVAGASNLFGITTRALFARAGVGIVVSQMLCEPEFGEIGLAGLQLKFKPASVLSKIVEDDPARETRQLVVMDASGGIAAHTGARCVQYAGQLAGNGFAVQGALLRNEEVLRATFESFSRSQGPLSDRLVSALLAGANAGGDLRGCRAAGLRVVAARPHSSWLENNPVDVRVDDHAQPVTELARLLQIQKAVVASDIAFDRGLGGEMAGALADFNQLEIRYPADTDVALRFGILLAFSGDTSAAAIRLRKVSGTHSGWREAVRRLPAAGFLPDDPALSRALDLQLPDGSGGV